MNFKDVFDYSLLSPSAVSFLNSLSSEEKKKKKKMNISAEDAHTLVKMCLSKIETSELKPSALMRVVGVLEKLIVNKGTNIIAPYTEQLLKHVIPMMQYLPDEMKSRAYALSIHPPPEKLKNIQRVAPMYKWKSSEGRSLRLAVHQLLTSIDMNEVPHFREQLVQQGMAILRDKASTPALKVAAMNAIQDILNEVEFNSLRELLLQFIAIEEVALDFQLLKFQGLNTFRGRLHSNMLPIISETLKKPYSGSFLLEVIDQLCYCQTLDKGTIFELVARYFPIVKGESLFTGATWSTKHLILHTLRAQDASQYLDSAKQLLDVMYKQCTTNERLNWFFVFLRHVCDRNLHQLHSFILNRFVIPQMQMEPVTTPCGDSATAQCLRVAALCLDRIGKESLSEIVFQSAIHLMENEHWDVVRTAILMLEPFKVLLYEPEIPTWFTSKLEGILSSLMKNIEIPFEEEFAYYPRQECALVVYCAFSKHLPYDELLNDAEVLVDKAIEFMERYDIPLMGSTRALAYLANSIPEYVATRLPDFIERLLTNLKEHGVTCPYVAKGIVNMIRYNLQDYFFIDSEDMDMDPTTDQAMQILMQIEFDSMPHDVKQDVLQVLVHFKEQLPTSVWREFATDSSLKAYFSLQTLFPKKPLLLCDVRIVLQA